VKFIPATSLLARADTRESTRVRTGFFFLALFASVLLPTLPGCTTATEYSPIERSQPINQARQFSPSQVDAAWPENNAVGPRTVGGGIAIRKHDGKPSGRPDGKRQGRNDK
jgi:hypothetical protein